MTKISEPYQLFSEPLRYYNAMVEDIELATKYIYIETFRIGNDVIGERFRRALTSKAKQGVEIKILIDYWGAGSADHNFFKELIDAGGELRLFKKIRFNTDLFTKGHRRNHRKLLLIDDEISWIGSSNLTDYNLNWRESMLRMKTSITETFVKLFMEDYRMYNKYKFNIAYKTRLVKDNGFEIVRDVPSITFKRINQKLITLIKNAQKRVLVETPYFLPGFMLRKAMTDAAKRGVEVVVIIPKRSDVNLIDILRNKYLGPLYQKGVRFNFYEANNLHAKLMLVDDRISAIGSSNFDYRSFRYMFEIMLFTKNSDIAAQVKVHIYKTLQNSVSFNYAHWVKRPLINKFFEYILLPFRHLL
ncbi:MAG: phosphatidylserine/phosphatidylglycerophosphate/cardiolipin synthase family protein [Chlorobi bacterium]|nr:phosphatidylserine/phosphatidylglycerophosphate/cardiolipin synthase family protein [Chlorobiota bacterium]